MVSGQWLYHLQVVSNVICVRPTTLPERVRGLETKERAFSFNVGRLAGLLLLLLLRR